MLRFLKDMIIFPFDKDKNNNAFWRFLQLAFKDYPAFLRLQPNIKKFLAFPFILLLEILWPQTPKTTSSDTQKKKSSSSSDNNASSKKE